MKKKLLSIILSVAVVLTMMPVMASAAFADTESVTYIDADGQTQTAECIVITSQDKCSFAEDTWYAVKDNVTINNRIDNNGSSEKPSHLILADGATLSAPKGITNDIYCSLCIYGQEESTGSLEINSVDSYYSAIGQGKNGDAGTLTINGGNISAKGGAYGSAIGANGVGTEGNIIINNGYVIADGGQKESGIKGTLTVNGGAATIYGQNDIAGIKGNATVNGGEITIYSRTGAGIEGSLTLNDGTVTSSPRDNGSGIYIPPDNSLIINGGTLEALSTNSHGIHLDKRSSFKVYGGTVTATSSIYSMGIYRDTDFDDNKLEIDEEKLEIVAGASAEQSWYQPVTTYLKTLDPYLRIQSIPSYEVQYLGQKEDGSGYEVMKTETIKSHTGEPAYAEMKDFKGFYCTKMDEKEKVKSDSSTVVHVYYDRHKTVHEHTFADMWSRNSEYHWHAATCEHTDLTSGHAKHNYDAGTISKGIKTYTCKTCGYQKTEKLSVAVPKTSIKSVKRAKKAFTVKWTKKSVTGYQIQYARNSKFTKSKKTVTVKSASTVSKKIKSLKKKKRYYVRVRCYINKYDTTYYSGWTAKKAVTTK